MESLNLQVDSPHNPIGQILAHDGRSLAMVDLGRDASKALRASWPTDQPPQSGGAIDSSWLLPMLGAGSTAASSLMAGSVFLATANPATLMTIGTGVGTAVMGPTGIVAQAPPKTTPGSRPQRNGSTKSGPNSTTQGDSPATCRTGWRGSITIWACCVPSTGS